MDFRNVDASPNDPVETWPFEGILAAIERGSLTEWRRLAVAIRADPWGQVARDVSEAADIADVYGTSHLMRLVVTKARADAAADERGRVAAEVRSAVEASGMSRADFAASIGTSASRLSTYTSGKVVPSASLLLRMRRVAGRHSVTS